MHLKRPNLPRFLAAALLALACLAPLPAMDLGTNFWNLKWHAQNDCFRDVRAVSGDDVWNPQFLEDIKPFQSLRFMDWDATNKSPRKLWSERPQANNPDQTVVAYEWMIDLCNRNNSDLWVCLPHQTIDHTQGDRPSDYALRLAILIRHGVDMGATPLDPLLDGLAKMNADQLIAAGGKRTSPGLKPGLRVYFEYSNETWNGMFSQTHYSLKEGTELALNPNPKPNAKGEDWVNAFRFHAWAAIRIFRAADLVFGANQARVEKVLATHIGNSGATRQHLAVMADPKLNPWGVKATAISPAPYFGHKVDGADPEAAVKLRADIKKVGEKSAQLKEIAASAGLKLIAYEGGQHVGKSAHVINRKPVMVEIYADYLTEMARYYDHFSHYCHVGKAGDRGAWGAMEKTGQPVTEVPKYLALVEYTAEHPRRPLLSR
jgi:hypothetical protein